MKKDLWIVMIIVVGFLGFMIGYSLPPFMEVGFGSGEPGEIQTTSEGNIAPDYEALYSDDKNATTE